MKRTVIKINESLCNGCGNCVSGCHEGALQMINGKAMMVSELYCDGLGACIGECPVGAIELIEKEADPYDEIAVMERIAPKGELAITAHLRHLKEHGENEWLKIGINWCNEHNISADLSQFSAEKPKMACGCPGSMERDFRNTAPAQESHLRQWPVQLHLLNPAASFFQGADVLLASDCSAFTAANFHETLLKNKTLAIACPKLDSNTHSYVEKIASMMDDAKINTLTVLMMEVPCCGGLLGFAKSAREKATRNVPIKAIILSVHGEILSENWV
ncbi:MAG: 4Fe-4S ferredoxin [Bacteroidetes bacterium GWF2_40_14]|nr:MAG: 4Fe-4S ferredoxin [Bacteroidetes bacterium GWF2_40_14]